jgi:hypothetical protein
MMKTSHLFAHGRRAARDPDRFVAEMHDAIGEIMERAMDVAFKVIDYVPWTADEITRQVESFVGKHVPEAEACAQATWDDAN